MGKVTLVQVAEHAGVSPSSVSRYVNDPHSIKPIPALRIEKAIKELGYIPNTFAQGLKRGQSNIIGVIVPQLGPFYVRICSALSDFFYQNRYLLFICETNNDPKREQYYINSLIGQQAAGILAATSGQNDDFLRDLQRHYPHILMLDNSADLPFDSVYENNRESSYLLTKYMIEQGHRKFIVLTHYGRTPNMTHRLNGVCQALQEAGLDIEDMYRQTEDTYKNFESTLQELMAQTPRATAIISLSPYILETCLITLSKMRKSIPEDIALAGYALEDFGARYKVDLPCVIQDPYDHGIQAGAIMLRRLKKPKDMAPVKQYCLKTRLHLPG